MYLKYLRCLAWLSSVCVCASSNSHKDSWIGSSCKPFKATLYLLWCDLEIAPTWEKAPAFFTVIVECLCNSCSQGETAVKQGMAFGLESSVDLEIDRTRGWKLHLSLEWHRADPAVYSAQGSIVATTSPLLF